MTAEEAIRFQEAYYVIANGEKAQQACEMAIEALEKQIPKSPERYIQPAVCVCPNCHGIIEAHTSKTFCTYCGQSITYGDSDNSSDE